MSYIVTDINKSSNDLNKVKELISGLNDEQKNLVINSSKLSTVEKTKLEILNGSASIINANTIATTANTTATKIQTISEEDELAQRWLSIGTEEADTVATTANTGSKAANLSITNLLKVAYAKLNAVMKANPYTTFAVAIVAVTAAMFKLKDVLETTPKEAKEAFDKATEDVNALKSEVDSLNSELDTTKSRIDELNAKENLTLVEQEELEKLKETNKELERELRIKQDLLTTESQEANDNAKKFFNTKVEGTDRDINGQALSTDYISATEQRLDKLKQYEQEIKDLELEQIQYQNENNGKSSYFIDEQIENRKNRIKEYTTYVNDAISDFMSSDDYLIEGLDDGLLARLDSLYEKFDIYTNGRGSVVEEKLSGILAKEEFQGTFKRLEELGKNGNLSKDALKDTNSEFSLLVEYLDKAGISAEELYQYIMALSNPNAVNYDEVERQFRESLGIRDGEINGASDQKKWDEITGSFNEDKWQIALDAYLKVRDQYGEHPEGWTVKDWLSNIQNEINNQKLEVEAELETPTISSSISQLATQLEPQFAELGEAYKAIFTENGFTLDNVDNSMLEKLRQSFAEIEEEVGVAFDATKLDPFFDILTNSSSTVEQVQQAFNDLATAYFYSTDTLEQLNAETADAIEKQLEES